MQLKVMLVDDDALFIMMQKRIVTKSLPVVQPLIAKNGQEALEIVLNDQDESPYLILLDINMPVMSGWEFLDAINEQLKGDRISVIMVSSSSEERDKEKAFTYIQVIGYYEKPINMEDFGKVLLLPKVAQFI